MEAKNQNLLDEALARGIITDAQRVELEAMRAVEATDSDERIKPVGSFNEIFVTVGVMLLLNALTGIVGLIIGKAEILSAVASLALVVVAAEYFHQRKRFRLPIIYCVLSAGMTAGTWLRVLLVGDADNFFDISKGWELAVLPMFASLAVFIAGAARYRIAFMMLPIGILFTVAVTFAADHAVNDLPFKLLLGACGLSLLAIAIHFDLKDPKRVTRASDFAFWTYIVGSPLFVHSLFLSVLIDADTIIGTGIWVLIAVLAAGVSFTGVLMNRRALILSTMIYVGYILFSALSNTPMGIATGTLVTVMCIGLYIIALGSRWAEARRYVMQRLPAWPWLARLPKYE